MNAETHEQAKKQFDEIAELLKDDSLTTEERHKFETLQAQLAGVLMSPWLPFGWVRRLIMVGLFFVGIYGFAQVNYYFLLAWLLVPIFSPRFVGECLNFSSQR